MTIEYGGREGEREREREREREGPIYNPSCLGQLPILNKPCKWYIQKGWLIHVATGLLY